MSTGADCRIEERERGRWWCRVQRWPYGDWPEYDDFGPADSPDAAYAMHDGANPGGYSIVRFETYHNIPCGICPHPWHNGVCMSWGRGGPCACHVPIIEPEAL